MKIWFTIGCCAILTWGHVCLAQGLLPDPPELVAGATVAEARRGLLPQRIDLTGQVPPPRSQVPSGTCVSWAVTYAAASDAQRRADPDHRLVTLSPAFTYALAGGTPTCLRGTSITRTLEVLRTTGTLPLDEYTFDGNDCAREPNQAELSRAARWRIKGWSKVDARDLNAVKAQLARGRPVIFGMPVGSKFAKHRGETVLKDLDTGPGLEGHAMVLIGYDDAREAFRLQNSHGRAWGDDGYAWIGYTAWQQGVFDGRGYVIE
jgi:C1A family cysteine protease